MKQEKMIIQSKRQLTPNVTELVLKGELVSEMKDPGQFIHVKAPRQDLLLRRPISLAFIDQPTQTCTVVIRADGEGTKAIVNAEIGSHLDVLGPLGHGFPTDFLKEKAKVLLIGGGIGIPPLRELASQLKRKGIEIEILLGFQNQGAVFYEPEFKNLGKVRIATDDGSYGVKGTVKTVIESYCQNEVYDAVYACGPKGLNRMVNVDFRSHPHAYISLEERMACGIGACAGCTVMKDDQSGNLKVCDDGPVFKCGEVIV